MSNEALKAPPVSGVDRSAPASAGVRREAPETGGGRKSDPEVVAGPHRRKFTKEYKLRILDQIDQGDEKVGMILRREGLYSSSITTWRAWREKMGSPKKVSSENKQIHNELAKVRRENVRLKLKLQKAEGLIELQKKTTELLEIISKQHRSEENTEI